MPKNTIGGKHKHLKKAPVLEKKFDLLDLDDHIEYAYATKAYGNRMFDAIILKSLKTVRFQAQYKRRKSRVVVGSLIKLSLVKDFTKETYIVEDICGENEIKAVAKSDDYEHNYKKVLLNNDMTYRSNNSSSVFEFDLCDENVSDDDCDNKNKISYTEAVMISDDETSDMEELNFDDL